MDADTDRRLVVLYGFLSEDWQCCLPCFSVTFVMILFDVLLKDSLAGFQGVLNKKPEGIYKCYTTKVATALALFVIIKNTAP